MIILGIETSCDETAIAVVEADLSRTRTPHESKLHTRQASSVRGRRRTTQINFKILSNVVSSQVELHKKYGGVWPTLAKREHQKNLVPVLKNALKGAKWGQTRVRPGSDPERVNPRSRIYSTALNSILKKEPELLKNLLSFLKKYQKPEIDLIALTNGPGLEPCLWVGINFAKALAFAWDLPIAPVNHIKAHILANFIGDVKCLPRTIRAPHQNPARKQASYEAGKFGAGWTPRGLVRGQMSNVKCLFPAVCLVVSGGHTQLILMKDFGKYKIIGETKDDAAGECFDKTARILGLGYPGGPAIAAEAAKLTTEGCHPDPERSEGEGSQPGNETLRLTAQGDRFAVKLPRPMINQKNYDFSFSGLKTAVLYHYKKQSKKIQKSQEYIQEMAKEIQQAIIDVLIKKTIKAAKDFRTKTIILGGGVTANKELRKQLEGACLKWNFKHLIPTKDLCTDNAAMTAVAGYFEKPKGLREIKAEANLRV